MVHIRPGRPQDLAWVLQASARSGWEQATPRERAGAQFTATAQRVETLVRGALSQPGGTLLVAEVSGHPAGYAVFCLQPNPLTGDPEGLLVDVAVEAGHRQQGVGRTLVLAAEERIRQMGARSGAVVAALQSTPALRLATSLGYWPERVLLVKDLPL